MDSFNVKSLKTLLLFLTSHVCPFARNTLRRYEDIRISEFLEVWKTYVTRNRHQSFDLIMKLSLSNLFGIMTETREGERENVQIEEDGTVHRTISRCEPSRKLST